MPLSGGDRCGCRLAPELPRRNEARSRLGVAAHTVARRVASRTAGSATTARTRRWVSAATGSRSFWKMLVTCFSTPRSVRKHARRDRRVRQPLGHQLEHLSLAGAELVDRIVAASPADELRDDARIERGAALGHPLDGGDEVGQVVDPVLQQIARPLRRSPGGARARSPPRRIGRERAPPSPGASRGSPSPRAVPRRSASAASGCRRSRCRACTSGPSAADPRPCRSGRRSRIPCPRADWRCPHGGARSRRQARRESAPPRLARGSDCSSSTPRVSPKGGCDTKRERLQPGARASASIAEAESSAFGMKPSAELAATSAPKSAPSRLDMRITLGAELEPAKPLCDLESVEIGQLHVDDRQIGTCSFASRTPLAPSPASATTTKPPRSSSCARPHARGRRCCRRR